MPHTHTIQVSLHFWPFCYGLFLTKGEHRINMFFMNLNGNCFDRMLVEFGQFGSIAFDRSMRRRASAIISSTNSSISDFASLRTLSSFSFAVGRSFTFSSLKLSIFLLLCIFIGFLVRLRERKRNKVKNIEELDSIAHYAHCSRIVTQHHYIIIYLNLSFNSAIVASWQTTGL